MGKVYVPARKQTPVVLPVVGHYTYWAIHIPFMAEN
jgi:hypothetical protein